jgi:hypothetical protein
LGPGSPPCFGRRWSLPQCPPRCGGTGDSSTAKASGVWLALLVAIGSSASLAGSGVRRLPQPLDKVAHDGGARFGGVELASLRRSSPVAGGAAFSSSAVESPLGVGSTWLARAAASSVVGTTHDSVSFLLGSGVVLTRGDVLSVASPAVVDVGCCGIVKVKAVPTCDLHCGCAWSDCAGEVVVVWSWWCGSSCSPLLVCCSRRCVCVFIFLEWA